MHQQRGIAIGPILFVLALMAVIVGAISAMGGGDMGSAIRADTITPQLRAQADLIRTKILECSLFYDSRPWPTHSGSGTLVSALECPSAPTGQKNLWTGVRPAQLPPPPRGFDPWYYVNDAATGGGRCIHIEPLDSLASDNDVRQGIARAASRYSSTEHTYVSGGASQRLVIWITPATGTPSTNCTG